MTTNVFTMDEHKYIQTQGIAMGKSCALSVANIFMAEWERQLTTATQHLPQPLLWRRYIDDIFGLYPGDVTQTQAYMAIANQLHPDIKLDITYSHNQVVFLELVIYVDSHTNILQTRIHWKPTDLHQYLRFESEHPYKAESQWLWGSFYGPSDTALTHLTNNNNATSSDKCS
jgi:hypothetical protein